MRWAAVAAFFVIGLLYADSSQAELWQCAQKNGVVMVTDTPQDPQNCEPYTGSLGKTPPKTTGDTPPKATKKKSHSIHTNFRGVRPAMTEKQVLARAGYPEHEYRTSCANNANKASCPKRWVYNYGRNRIAEVRLENGRVTDIKNLPRP